MVAMAFKLVEDAYGTLTFMRLYQGSFRKGGTYYNQRTGRKERFSRIVRVHADQREEIEAASAGDIVAVLGVDAASGDTYASEYPYCTLESMYVPEPVIKDGHRVGPIATAPTASPRPCSAPPRGPHAQGEHRRRERASASSPAWANCTWRFYVERIRREFNVEVEGRPPKVNYREAPTQACEFNTAHRKQTGQARASGHIVGRLEVLPEDAEGAVPSSRNRCGRADSQASSSRRMEKGLSPVGPQGPGEPAIRVVGPESDHRGRIVSRGGQFRHGLPDFAPARPARELPAHAGPCCWSR